MQVFARFYGDSPDDLRAWLRAILLNKLATFSRSYRGADKRRISREVHFGVAGDDAGPSPLEPPAAEPTPSNRLLEMERNDALHDALRRLPEHYRQVIHWRQWEECSFEEIGRRLERSVDAARMLWWRAIACLEKELNPSS